MFTYSNRLQPALQNLLQRVVRFFHPRLSCPTHISADVCSGRKSLVKPVTWQNISSCLVLSPEIVMHDDAYIGGRSENNIKCIVHDDLGWKNWTTFSLTALLAIGIRFRIVLSHHHLLLASSVNSGLLIFTCSFSVMSTCNTGHLSEQDCSCLGVL